MSHHQSQIIAKRQTLLTELIDYQPFFFVESYIVFQCLIAMIARDFDLIFYGMKL